MKQVTLPGSSTTTSPLGYGCSSLMARTGRAESLRLLEAAFEAGITHFDVARSYGYGEAEGVLGTFLRERRDQVTVTTKLGISPPPASRALSLAKVAAKRAVSVAAPLRGVARRTAGRLQTPGRFDVPGARASLETSLRQLQTDYVDVLLLHEARPEDVSEELLAFLEEQVALGTVCAFGLATSAVATRTILPENPRLADVVQLASSITQPARDEVTPLGGGMLITHSSVGLPLAEVHGRVARSAALARTWSECLGSDVADRQVLGELLLAWAVADNIDGIVLFSSRDPTRIRTNVEGALSRADGTEPQALAALVRGHNPA